jgi:hypothetical protein
MQVRRQGSLLIPETSPTQLCLFIDETYFYRNTGFIQTAIVLPENVYRDSVKPACRRLLRQFDVSATEFHANRISSKTAVVRIYSQLLQYIVNAISLTSDASTIRSIISVDSYDQYINQNYTTIRDSVRIALASLQVSDLGRLEEEISRQIVWLIQHINHAIPTRYRNHLKIIFDNKHNLARECRNLRTVQVNGRPPTLLETERIIKVTLNAFFSVHANLFNLPHIDHVSFCESEREFGLQAADLFSNLMYGAIRYAKGITIPATSIRNTLLNTVMPGLIFDQALLNSLQVQRTDAICTNPDLISTFTLQPT